MQNLFLSATARGKLTFLPNCDSHANKLISSPVNLVEADFKINLASFPYSGWQISRLSFSFYKRTLKAAACEKRSSQPLLLSKIIGCSHDYRKKKSGHICCSASCQETVLAPPPWSDFTHHSFFLLRLLFLVLFQITAPYIRGGKLGK